MSQAYSTLSDNQKSQCQTLFNAQSSAIQALWTFIKAQQYAQAVWSASGATLGLLASAEEWAISAPVLSPFANPTMSVGDLTNLANALSVVQAAATSGQALTYWGNILGQDKVTL